MVVVKAKHDTKCVKASGTTKSEATLALRKNNANPVKQHRKIRQRNANLMEIYPKE